MITNGLTMSASTVRFGCLLLRRFVMMYSTSLPLQRVATQAETQTPLRVRQVEREYRRWTDRCMIIIDSRANHSTSDDIRATESRARTMALHTSRRTLRWRRKSVGSQASQGHLGIPVAPASELPHGPQAQSSRERRTCVGLNSVRDLT